MAAKMKGLNEASIDAAILKSFKDNEEIISDINTSQLQQGEFVTGKKLPEYSERSIVVFGKRPGPWTLFNHGNFYRGWFIKAEKFDIVFGSNDIKTGFIADSLAAKGENPDDIYGLNKSNLSKVCKEITLPYLGNFVRSFLHV